MELVFELSEVDQLELAATLARYIPSRELEAVAADKERRRRLESLTCLRQVADKVGHPPTTAEYREVAAELGLDWSWQQIQRLWGWSRALEALESGHAPWTAAERSFRRKHTRRRRSRREPTEAVKLWMEGKPEATNRQDYDDWAREHNYRLEDGDLPVPRAGTVINSLGLRWREVLLLARGDRERDELLEGKERKNKGDWSRGERLISVTTIGVMSGRAASTANLLLNEYGCPAHVATFSGRRAWLFDEIARYLEDEEVPSHAENNLQDKYMTAEEFFSAVGFVTFNRHRKPVEVEPHGKVAGMHYWLRAEVEEWVRKNQARVEARRDALRGRTVRRAAVREDFVAATEIARRLGIATDAVAGLVSDPGFPTPLAINGPSVWHWPQVEAFVAHLPVPESPVGVLGEILIDRLGLAEILALAPAKAHPSDVAVPMPFTDTGLSYVWRVSDVYAWAREDPVRLAKVNARRARRGLEPIEDV